MSVNDSHTFLAPDLPKRANSVPRDSTPIPLATPTEPMLTVISIPRCGRILITKLPNAGAAAGGQWYACTTQYLGSGAITPPAVVLDEQLAFYLAETVRHITEAAEKDGLL